VLPSSFEYHRPATLGEALDVLASLGDEAKVLAGGQSLIPMMKLRFASPGHLVDINRLEGLNEQLVRGREDRFFSAVIDAEATIQLPRYAVRYYADGFASSRAALRGSFGFYRAWDATAEQNEARQATKLTMPVLAVGGEKSSGDAVRAVMQKLASDVQGLVIPGAGHFLAEEAPEQVLAALTEFLAPYRDGPPAR